MRVKLDEDLGPLVAEPLQAAGYVVAGVVQQGWGGPHDSDLWERISAEGAFFITADKGFADIRAYPPGTHNGVLLLRPDRESILDYRALLETVVRNHSLDSLAGAVTVVTPRGIRIRRAPGSERGVEQA